MKRRYWKLSCIAALSLAGCTSTPVEEHYYSILLDALSDSRPPSPATSNATLTLTSIKLPEYLQSRNLVMQVGDNEVVPARRHFWAEPLDESIGQPTDEEMARLRLLTAIESLSDSAMIEAERERRATDWTYTDDEGNRWGVSPGRLHLGSVSIPLPFGFGPPPDYNGDQARRAFELQDIDRAAGTRAVRESWKERVEAMRERREQRRAEEEAEEDEERPRVRPDTTGVRR